MLTSSPKLLNKALHPDHFSIEWFWHASFLKIMLPYSKYKSLKSKSKEIQIHEHEIQIQSESLHDSLGFV